MNKMPRHRASIARASARIACAFASTLLAAPALAGSLQVDPVKVEISAERKVGSVRLKNEGSEPVTVHAHALSWAQAAGADVHGAAPAIIVSPPIFTIPAGGTQLVRVGHRGAAAPAAYRLIVEEVPEADSGHGVQVALRLDLPLYVLQKAGSLDQLNWTAWQEPGRGWVLEAKNPGTGYVRVDGTEASRHTGLSIKAGLFGTVLPGSSRRWTLGDSAPVSDRAKFERIVRKGGEDAQAQLASKR